MFFQHRVYLRHTVLHELQTGRGKLHTTGTLLHLLTAVLELYIITFEPVGKLTGSNIMCRHTRKSRCCLTHCLQHTAFIAVNGIAGAIERSLYLLGMRKFLKFQLKFLKFTALWSSSLNLVELETQPLFIATTRLKRLFALHKFTLQRCILLVALLILKQLFLVAGKSIKHTKLIVPVAQQKVLVLRVNIYKACTDLLEYRHIDRCIVHKCTATAACCKLTTYYALGIVVKVILLKESLKPESRNIEGSFYDTPIGTLPDSFRIGTLAKEHRHGTQEHRLSVTRLTGDHRKSLREVNLHLFNECKVAYSNMLQHYSLNYCSL